MEIDLKNMPLYKPIEPYINEDGYYPQCKRCWTELEPEQFLCLQCGQVQDWSWRSKYQKKGKNKYEKF